MSKPDYSENRRQTVISLLRAARKDSDWWDLTGTAKLTYTVGAVICDEAGAFNKSDLEASFRDVKLVSHAKRLMREAGV